MADTPKHSVSVAGIVVDDQDRVLVIQRRDNAQWEPPGGILELTESPEAGARREVLEETGVEVEIERLSGVYKNMNLGVVALVFRCYPIGGQARQSDESVRAEWLPLPEILSRVAPSYAIRISDAFEKDVPVRVHDGYELIRGGS